MLRGGLQAASIAPFLLRSFIPSTLSLCSTARKPVVDTVTPWGTATATVTATVTPWNTVTAPLAAVVTAPGVTRLIVTAPGVARVIVTTAGARGGVRRMGKKAGKGKEGKGSVPAESSAPTPTPTPVTEGLGPVPPCLRVTSTGAVSIAVHAKPGSKQAAVSNVSSAAVGVAIDAPAREGEANDALLEYLAQVLKLKKRQLSLQSGAKSREKVVLADGCTLQEVHRALMAAQDH